MLTEDFKPGYMDEEDQTDTKVDQEILIWKLNIQTWSWFAPGPAANASRWGLVLCDQSDEIRKLPLQESFELFGVFSSSLQ